MNKVLVVILTKSQKDKIQGKEFTKDSLFNVILDANNKWVISIEEIEQITNEEFSFLKDLPTIDFTPKKETI